MSKDSVVQRSFAGGEIAPALHARADLAKYGSGLRACRNFLVQRHGGVANRPGLRYIGACKTTAATVSLLRYVSEVAGQSLLIECGNGYFRFFQNGASLQVVPASINTWDVAINYVVGDLVKLAGINYYARIVNLGVSPPAAATWYPLTGNTYELPSPFGVDLPNWVQSGRTITFTHKDHLPYELTFVTLTRWILTPVTTAPVLTAPTGLVLTIGGAGALRAAYVITARNAVTYEQSPSSGQVVNAAAAAPTLAAPNVLTWTATAGAVEYDVYSDPYGNSTYGFIGTATGALTFKDRGIPPDYTVTPPIARVLFNATDNYPHVAAYFQQRRFFGYTNTNPDAVWASRTGFPSNFGISSPLQNDDSLTFRLAGNNNNPVRHLRALKSLVVVTDSGEWAVTNGAGGPLTPNGIDADQIAYLGANTTPPVIVGNALLYVQARGAILRDLQLTVNYQTGVTLRDLSIFAEHLFRGVTLTEIDYAQTPDSIVWAIRSDGALLGLTYVLDQDVWGWHRHDTGAAGTFEHVCVVPELAGDVVYVIVRRTIGGATARYIEKLEKRAIVTFNVDAFFVDAGLTYTGAPVANIAGLDHLNGQVVAVVGDGTVVFNGDPASVKAVDFTVTAGTLPKALPASYSTIHAGLPIRFAEIETLDLDVQGTVVRDKKKRVGSVTVLLEKSARTFSTGPEATHLVPYALKPYEIAAQEFTGLAEINLTSTFGDNGRVFLRQTDPLPITILGVLPNLEVGG